MISAVTYHVHQALRQNGGDSIKKQRRNRFEETEFCYLLLPFLLVILVLLFWKTCLVLALGACLTGLVVSLWVPLTLNYVSLCNASGSDVVTGRDNQAVHHSDCCCDPLKLGWLGFVFDVLRGCLFV
jgi:hypothetical protein